MIQTRFLVGSVVSMGLLLGGCSKPQGAPAVSPKMFAATADVSTEQAKKLLDSDKSVVYLDVRTVAEFEESHPVGAWNIPFLVRDTKGGRKKNADFLPVVEASFRKDAKLVVGCRSGGRSKMAQRVLKSVGFTNVVNMLGGFSGKSSAIGTTLHQGWSQLGLPTETGPGGAHGYAKLKTR